MNAGRASADEAERLARVALSLAVEPAEPTVARAVTAEGAESVRGRLLSAGRVEGAELAAAAERLRRVDPASELELAQLRGLRFVVPGDDEWPAQLDDLEHAPEVTEGRGGVPLGLWVRGPARLDSLGNSVAVVGSRSATDYGTGVAREMGGVIARKGWAVVSGAAFGIDQAAHRGALAAGGVTVTVLACGADRCYPAAH